jgi:hypothetical protein
MSLKQKVFKIPQLFVFLFDYRFRISNIFILTIFIKYPGLTNTHNFYNINSEVSYFRVPKFRIIEI